MITAIITEKSTPTPPTCSRGMIERSGPRTGSVRRAKSRLVPASAPLGVVVGNQLSSAEMISTQM